MLPFEDTHHYVKPRSLSRRSRRNPGSGHDSDKLLRLFTKAGGLLGTSLEEEENFLNLHALIVPEIADALRLWLLDSNGRLQERRLARSSPRPSSRSSATKRSADDWGTNPPPLEVMRTGIAVRSEKRCALPLKARHQVIGVLECRNESDRKFDVEDFIALDEIAQRTAIAFENARLFQALKKTEAQLREAKLQAESASHTKSQFLANMSHEIRTPLGAILGFVDLMLSPGESQQDYIQWGQKIKKNGKHLLGIIDEILDLSKIESGHLELSKQTLQLPEYLQEIHLTLLPQAVRKNVRLEFHLDSPLPSQIVTDPTRFKQILFNLIGNAIKFTEEGSVRVGIRYCPSEDTLKLSISDTGIGLSEEQAGRLFKSFSQGDASHTRRFGGTGLGLVLSRNLARMMGGDVTLTQTAVGAGSTFEVTIYAEVPMNTPYIHQLPGLKHAPAHSTDLNPKKLAGLSLLLVEDSPDNQFLISRFLKTAGAQVEVAEDGARGLEMAMRNNYDLILMDIQMPFLNGHQVTEILRKNGDERPIIALTAHALKEELEKSLNVGCDDHLTKPIDRERLIEVIYQHSHAPSNSNKSHNTQM